MKLNKLALAVSVALTGMSQAALAVYNPADVSIEAAIPQNTTGGLQFDVNGAPVMLPPVGTNPAVQATVGLDASGQTITKGLTEGGTNWASGNTTLTFNTNTWKAPVFDATNTAATLSAASNVALGTIAATTTVSTTDGVANGLAHPGTAFAVSGAAVAGAIPLFATFTAANATTEAAAGPNPAAASGTAAFAYNYGYVGATTSPAYTAAYNAAYAPAYAIRIGLGDTPAAAAISAAATAAAAPAAVAVQVAAGKFSVQSATNTAVVKGYKYGPTLTAGQIAAGQAAGMYITTAAGTGNAPAVATRSKAGGGLLGTDHDFTKANNATTSLGGNANVKQVGLCTFCHTPHKASSTLLLWNHTLSKNSFSWDVSATTAGTALPGFNGASYNNPSAKCLSCHDGSVAIGDVGWFSQSANTASGTNGTSNTGVPLNAYKVGSASVLTGAANKDTKIVGAGGDLTGTHPVSIPYPLNAQANVYNGSTTGARLATNDWVLDPTTSSNIRLYTDLGGGTIVGKVTPGKTGIECSSCHDPHNKATLDSLLLRGKNAGATKADGYICLQCHVK